MIVDHADRLHEGIADGRADELEAARGELLRHLSRKRRFRRHLRYRAEMIDLGLAVEKVPKKIRKMTRLHDREIGARGTHRALDL
jgi:hypothetical protein